MPPSDPTTDAAATSRRRRAARGDGDQLRDELLDAAEALLRRKGSMEAVSVRAIASEVGVTPPSLYLHFADKDDLFFAVCERRFADFAAALEASVAGIDDPVERLEAMGRAYVRYGVERAEHYLLLFGPQAQVLAAGRDLTDSAGMRAFGLLVETVADGVARGALATDDVWTAALSIWSGVHGATMVLLSKDMLGEQFPLPSPDVLAGHVCATLMQGLAAD